MAERCGDGRHDRVAVRDGRCGAAGEHLGSDVSGPLHGSGGSEAACHGGKRIGQPRDEIAIHEDVGGGDRTVDDAAVVELGDGVGDLGSEPHQHAEIELPDVTGAQREAVVAQSLSRHVRLPECGRTRLERGNEMGNRIPGPRTQLVEQFPCGATDESWLGSCDDVLVRPVVRVDLVDGVDCRDHLSFWPRSLSRTSR